MSGSPFVVLHVCMGNICRSPMSERLLMHAVRERVGDRAAELIVSESSGTGDWHVGQAMNPPAAQELRRRGVSDEGFRARKLIAGYLDTADLILTATSEQLDFVGELRPDATERAFVLGEFGRLTTDLRVSEDAAKLPTYAPDPDAVRARGMAIVTAADVARAGRPSRASDDLDDPWGRSGAFFRGTADQVIAFLDPFVDLLFPVVGAVATD